MSVTIDSTNPRIIADNIRKLDDAVKAANELPEVETTDQGKVLTVNSSGEWAALDPASQLPSVTAADEGSLLTVNSSGAWVKGSPIIGNKDYSSTEVATRLKIDGKDIYQITFSGTTQEEAGNVTFGTISGFDVLVHMYGSIGSTYIHAIERALDLSINKNNGSVNGSISGSYVSAPYILTVLYTKTEPTRELEAAPELEAEPVLKKSTRKKTTIKEEE